MLNEVLNKHFNQADLETITRANLRQDWPHGQLHPEYHFDDSAFAESEAYLNQQRQLTRDSLSAKNRAASLAALGRLLHIRQDFYAHSNWVNLWVERHGGLLVCSPKDVELCTTPQVEPDLVSGTASIPRYLLYRIPLLGPFVKRFYFPPDSHEAMNLDHPGQGSLFDYAMAAATKHTQVEFDLLLAEIAEDGGETAVAYFLGSQNEG
ncbi:MAG: hypothetical protein GWP17_04060 [Aquificales bacterium]|nr:hypothetical protein [Aquificales bacterium]